MKKLRSRVRERSESITVDLPELRQITFEEDALYHCKDLLFFSTGEVMMMTE